MNWKGLIQKTISLLGVFGMFALCLPVVAEKVEADVMVPQSEYSTDSKIQVVPAVVLPDVFVADEAISNSKGCGISDFYTDGSLIDFNRIPNCADFVVETKDFSRVTVAVITSPAWASSTVVVNDNPGNAVAPVVYYDTTSKQVVIFGGSFLAFRTNVSTRQVTLESSSPVQSHRILPSAPKFELINVWRC